MDERKIAELTREVRLLAVLTDAGVSTDSGIPDYRGPNGVWTRDPSAVEAFRYDRFLADPQVRARFWRTYLGHAGWRVEPNAAHRALVGLERAGIAIRVLPQNVDGLHQATGLTPRKVLELHGNMHPVTCTGLPETYPDRRHPGPGVSRRGGSGLCRVRRGC